MNCPFCGAKMLEGYLKCGAAIWSERKHWISVRPNEEEKYALRLKQPIFSPHQIKSNCCPQCKKIVIDAAGYENGLK